MGTNLMPASGSIWPSPGWMAVGRTRASSVLAQPPAPKLECPPSMIRPAPFSTASVRSLLLTPRQEAGVQVAQDVDVVAAGGELVVGQLAAIPLRLAGG